MYKGIIFDMDGTMIDNMMIHHRAWQQKLSQIGLDLSIEEVKEKIHGVNEEILERLFGDRFSSEERRRIAWEKEAAYREIYRPQLQLLPGLEVFLNEAQAAGIPMAIGTAAPPENAHFVIEQLQLEPYFKGVFHSKDVSRGKPDPEIFQLAAQSMGLSTKECLIFEDSLTGAEAAQRADTQAVIVTTTHAEEEFQKFDHIRAFIPDFSKLDMGILN
jgi:beta-phosphoglucomutase family hydrolase